MTTWERRTEWPLALASALFLACYAWPILDDGLSHPWARACAVVTWAVWAVFAVDYVVRLVTAGDRPRWFVRHLLDLAVIALPILRPLRLLRLVTLLRVLNRSASDSLRGRVAIYVAGGSLLLAFVAALAELDAERAAPGANITGFGDALWWACTTMATVGYGDRYPVTGTGRLVAVLLMVGGIALLGTVTATLASWLIEHVRGEEQEQVSELVDLRAEIARLTVLVEGLTESHAPDSEETGVI
jgi:voltage-gated potassium channel